MKKFTSIIFSAAVILIGCGNNPPELKQIYSQINFISIPGAEKINSELIVLVNTDDEDGADDIESLYLIRDEKELSWSVDRNEWSERDSRGMKWTGSGRFSTTTGAVPEPGEYRVLVIDRAGERDEDSIFVPIVKDKPAADEFADLVFTDNETLELTSMENRNLIAFYDSAGKLLGAWAATPGQIKIKNLRDGASILENYRTVKVSYYSNTYGAGLISGPYNRP